METRGPGDSPASNEDRSMDARGVPVSPFPAFRGDTMVRETLTPSLHVKDPDRPPGTDPGTPPAPHFVGNWRARQDSNLQLQA